MSIHLWGVGNLPKTKSLEMRVITARTIVATVSVAMFILTELIAVAGSAVWAIAGFFHLTVFTGTVLAFLISIPTIYAAIATAILAFDTETDPENNQDAYSDI
jgi:hypothetical protein